MSDAPAIARLKAENALRPRRVVTPGPRRSYPKTPRPNTKRAKILAALEKGPLCAADLAATCGMEACDVHAALNAMTRKDLVERHAQWGTVILWRLKPEEPA